MSIPEPVDMTQSSSVVPQSGPSAPGGEDPAVALVDNAGIAGAPPDGAGVLGEGTDPGTVPVEGDPGSSNDTTVAGPDPATDPEASPDTEGEVTDGGTGVAGEQPGAQEQEYATSGEAQAAWESEQRANADPNAPAQPSYGYADPTGHGAYADAKMREYGWDANEMLALVPLWNETASDLTQSHTGRVAWDPEARNLLNGASGIPGLLQDTIETMGDPTKWDDPQHQIDVGLEYIKGKYKTPSKALAHMRKYNWY